MQPAELVCDRSVESGKKVISFFFFWMWDVKNFGPFCRSVIVLVNGGCLAIEELIPSADAIVEAFNPALVSTVQNILTD